MKLHLNKSVTLLELLIAIALLAVIALGFSSIELFSRYHVLSSDRRAKLQNEASYALEHMTKEISKTIGSTVISAQPAVQIVPMPGDLIVGPHDRYVVFYVDLAVDGVSPGDGIYGTQGDCRRAYRWRCSSASEAERYQVWYYPTYVNDSSWHEVIANRIAGCAFNRTENAVYVNIIARWEAAQPVSPDNPEVTLRTRIKMPGVSTH